MQAVHYKQNHGRNFVKENIRHARNTQFRFEEETAPSDSKVRTSTSSLSCSKAQRCGRRNLKASTPRKKVLVASLQSILKNSHSQSGRKYLPRYQGSYQEDHQKAEPENSLQYTAPLKLRKKKHPASQRKKHLPRRNSTKARNGQLGGNISMLHNKLKNVQAMMSFHPNAWNAVSNISSNMFAHKALQLKGNRKSKVLKRKLKSLTKFWKNGADNVTKSDATDSDENQIMANDQRSSASQYTTQTSSTFDATAKDILKATTVDPETTKVLLSNKSTENDKYTSTVNEKSVSSSVRNTDLVTVEQKLLDASPQQVLNVSCSNPKEDMLREVNFDEQHEFGQQLTESDYHLRYVPPLVLKRKKNVNSFNKEQDCRRNFIKENIRDLRLMQIRLNEKRSNMTLETSLQSRHQKVTSKMLSQYPVSRTSQKHCSKISRRKMQNKNIHQQTICLHKVIQSNLQNSNENERAALDQSSSISVTSVHDSRSSTISDETSRNSSFGADNDKGANHMSSSDDKENLLSSDVQASPNAIKNYSDANMMKENVLAPHSQDYLNASSPQQRKSLTESLNIKMTAKAMAARQKILAPTPPNPLKAPPSYQKGVLPRYLQSRQEEQKKEECVRQLRDPDCPPGYVRLPDIERRETLSILRKYYGDLIQGMNMLPVQTTATKIQQKKMDIEKQLEKLQAAIKVFSKPKVFMKVGS